MNILIVGDSLSFPRRTQNIKDSWPSILQDLLKSEMASEHVFWFRSQGGADIYSVQQEVRQLSGYIAEKEIDLAIVQVGIVDCTPRPYSRLVSNIIKSNRAGIRIKVFIHKHLAFFYQFYSSPFVSQKMWRKKIEETAEELKKLSKQTVFLSIAPPGEISCKKVPKIESIIKEYNKILFNTVENFAREHHITVVDPYNNNDFDIKTDLMQNDGHHLTITGHYKVSRTLYNYISNKVLPKPSKEILNEAVS